jgi:hypothetical protein
MQLSQLPATAMQYPLTERIGAPDLFVGRVHEMQDFHKWIETMPRLLAPSRALLARRKSGKTAFVQRLFNQLWSANGQVIPFYFSVPETELWYPTFALLYYRTFATQYISFLERDAQLVRSQLSMEQIRAYGASHGVTSLVEDVDSILHDEKEGHMGLMWDRVYRAPHRTASIYDQRILVMIDEFQYLATNIKANADLSGEPVESMPGSYHEVSESRVAPLLLTGSYVGWMREIMRKYLEPGRIDVFDFSPYLTEEEGLLAVYTYAEALQVPITNETAVQINTLCQADPFFISCVMNSRYPQRDLTTTQGVIETVNHTIANRRSFFSRTWAEYIEKTVKRINDQYGKHILLHMSKHNDRDWTARELKQVLQLKEDEITIQNKLLSLVKGDLLEQGDADIDFRGLQDGTLNLVLRHRFEKEILHHEPDMIGDFNAEVATLTKENQTLRGKLNHIKGQLTEVQFANTLRSRKRFRLADFFAGANDDQPLNLLDVQTRVMLQRPDGGKKEVDIVAQTSDERVLLVDVKNQQEKPNHETVEDFLEKAALYQSQNPGKTLLLAFLSLGGFTEKALELCRHHGIAWTTELQYF